MTVRSQLDIIYEKVDPFNVRNDPADENRKHIIISVLNKFIERFRHGVRFKRVLDIGCGEGWITEEVPADEIIGFDLSTVALSRCSPGIKTVSRYDEIEGEFDLIIIAGVLVQKHDCEAILDLVAKHASGLVLTCHTLITEFLGISRFKEYELINSEFPYREQQQILRLFNFGSEIENKDFEILLRNNDFYWDRANGRDIHDYPIDLPDTVYILGSGPNGNEVLSEIPHDAFVIGLNRGAAIPLDKNVAFDISAWIIADHTACSKPYFKQANEVFEGYRIFSELAASSVPGFGKYPGRDFTFQVTGRDDLRNFFIPYYRVFRSDCTVAGCALWLCHMAGVKSVKLIGIDMGGDADYSGPLPEDDRHGETWRYRQILDAQILWHRELGMAVETLSETKLANCGIGWTRADVAYLCMTHNEINMRHAIINALEQDYPDEMKTLYLLHQEPFDHDNDLEYNGDMKIIHIDVPGKWPAVWLWKLIAFIHAAREEITIIWDEDDRFESRYTKEIVERIKQCNVQVTWNPKQILLNKTNIIYENYEPFWGTLGIKTDFLRELVLKFTPDYKDGINHKPEREVALDDPFCEFIKKESHSSIEHYAKRYYFNHLNCYSQKSGHFSKETAIDYEPIEE